MPSPLILRPVEVTLKQIRKALGNIDDEQFSVLVYVVTGSLAVRPDDKLETALQLKMLLYGWLSRFSFVSDHARRRILIKLESALSVYLSDAETDHELPPGWSLNIADERYVSWAGGNPVFWDMKLDKDVEDLPHTPVTHYTLSFDGMYERMVRMTQDAGNTPSPGTSPAVPAKP